eukprot:6721576-Ditylum_brightwellii.AAC.1
MALLEKLTCPLDGKYVHQMGILLQNMRVQHLDKLHPSVLKAMGCYQRLAFSVVQWSIWYQQRN